MPGGGHRQRAVVAAVRHPQVPPEPAHGIPVARVHPRAGQVAAESQAQRQTRAAGPARQREVLGQIAGDRGVPAERVVGTAPEHEQLAVGRRRGGHRHAQQTVRQERQQHVVDQRYEQPFAQRDGALAGERREHIRPLPAHLRPARVDRTGCQQHVGVAEQQDVAACGRGQLPAGPALAHPAGRRRRAAHQAHARVGLGGAAHDGGRVVAGLVVEHDDLGDVLGSEPGQRGGQPAALITRWDQQRRVRPGHRSGPGRIRSQHGEHGEVRHQAGQLDRVEGDGRARQGGGRAC